MVLDQEKSSPSNPQIYIINNNIMDPPGVFIVFGILHFYTDTDTDIVTGTVGTLLHRPGLDPGTSK